MPSKLLQLIVAATATSALSGHTVLYLENFRNLQEFSSPATQTGWQAFRDDNPDSHLWEVADPNGQQFNSPLGNPEGVNNNPVPGAEFGAVFWGPTASVNVTIATQEFAGVLQSSELLGFTWDYSVDSPSGGEGAEFHKRALVQVGGSASDTDNWYVSDPMIVFHTATLSNGEPPNGFFQARWEQTAVSAAGNWIRVPFYDYANRTFTWPRTGIAKTASNFAGYEGYTFYKGPLPDGVVHGFGILIDQRRGGNFWIDNYTILGASEPSGAPTGPAPTLSIQVQGNDVHVSFESSASLTYQMFKSTDGMHSFHAVGEMAAGNDGLKTFVDHGGRPATGHVFYRVRVSNGEEITGGLHDAEEIAATFHYLDWGDPEATAAFWAIADEAPALLAHVPQAPAIFDAPAISVDNQGHQDAFFLLGGDVWAAYAMALLYRLDHSPGREIYGNKALEVLNAWASNNHSVTGGDGHLMMAYGGVGLLHAAQLMRSSSLWSDPDRQQFESWVRTVFLGSCSAIRGRRNNWGDWGIFGAITAHNFLGERFALEADATQLRNKIDRRINSEGILPEEVHRGSAGLWYTYFSLAPLTAAANVLYNAQLADFFNYVPESGGGLRLALDYLFTYCLDPGSWPHHQWGLVNPPSPDTFYGTLFEAMAEIYGDADYAAWVEDSRPIMNDWHHFSWAAPTLIRPRSSVPANATPAPPIFLSTPPSAAVLDWPFSYTALASTRSGTTFLGVSGAPDGLTLTDNGNGTATLAGIPTTPGAYPVTLIAQANGQTSEQSWILTVYEGGAGGTIVDEDFSSDPGSIWGFVSDSDASDKPTRRWMNPGNRLATSVLTARGHHQGDSSIQSTAHYRMFTYRENITDATLSTTGIHRNGNSHPIIRVLLGYDDGSGLQWAVSNQGIQTTSGGWQAVTPVPGSWHMSNFTWSSVDLTSLNSGAGAALDPALVLENARAIGIAQLRLNTTWQGNIQPEMSSLTLVSHRHTLPD
ncbi:MAG: alginate lyase family protein [Opitutales bacterium]|nr:alginate lyase family protein [Opitutales bacterium]